MSTERIAEVRRHQNWMIYSLPKRPVPELEQNLKCLQDCVQTDPLFRRDLKGLGKLLRRDEPSVSAACC